MEEEAVCVMEEEAEEGAVCVCVMEGEEGERKKS
jgi:hypothetical protein